MASYTLEHKRIAFSIYRKTGKINETFRELKKDPRFKTFNKTTLLSWAKTPDESGRIWEERLKEINVVKNEISDRDYINEKEKITTELRNMMDLLYKQALEKEVKSGEGAARTYSILVEQYNKLSGIDITKEQFVLMYRTILECFSVHPVVGPIIKQYWHELEMNLNIEYEKVFRK